MQAIRTDQQLALVEAKRFAVKTRARQTHAEVTTTTNHHTLPLSEKIGAPHRFIEQEQELKDLHKFDGLISSEVRNRIRIACVFVTNWFVERSSDEPNYGNQTRQRDESQPECNP